MSTNIEYITKPGDRWDLIAYKAYGTVGIITLEDGEEVNALSHIAAANPGIPISSLLQEGLVILIPVIPSSTVKTSSELLPPWKR